MGKKKKGGKGKEKSEDGLPPPPNLDNYREGAQEALLTFKIQGKEESILQYEEDAEVFKDRNCRQKEKNYDLKAVQTGYRRTMFQQALEYESEQAGKEEVARDTVELAVWEKLQLTAETQAELQGLEERIVVIEQELERERKELEKWQKYKDSTVHKEETHICSMRKQMVQMKEKEIEMESEKDGRMIVARQEIDAKWQRRMEREKELISEQLLNSLDRDKRAEMVDNGWMKREIQTVKVTVEGLRREVDQLELRNLHLLEDMQREQLQDLEASVELLQASMGQTRVSHTASAAGIGDQHGSPSLPSLVDVSKNTASRGAGGQLGLMEQQMLNVRGKQSALALPPDMVHLPPLAQQKSSHSALPTRTSWPITANMLNSLA